MSDLSIGFPSRDQPDRVQERSAALARNWWAIMVRGVAAVVFGIIALLLPTQAVIVLALVFGFYLLVDGVFDLVAAIRAVARGERWGFLLAEGVLDIVVGVLALAWPATLIVASVWVIGAWALVTGILLLLAALRLSAGHGNWLMGLGGVLSIVWGVLLALWPLAGAVVLTIWLGVYALLFGIALIALAFKLRSRHLAAL
ncbi:MAG: HdeD family acid-resistance protein [Alphaproteobacteria bacterium]|nr:HdeD family acid-resistance protein [Alphaproteobacteria bacterium]